MRVNLMVAVKTGTLIQTTISVLCFKPDRMNTELRLERQFIMEKRSV